MWQKEDKKKHWTTTNMNDNDVREEKIEVRNDESDNCPIISI